MKRMLILTISIVLARAGAVMAQPHLKGKPVRITPAQGVFQQPVWSPDGQWIAVTGPRYDGIYIVRPNGESFKQITRDAAVGFKMSWSPDATYLLGRAARWHRRRRFNSIKIYNILTGEARQVSEERTFMPAIPVWAAANDRILLQADRGLEIFNVPVPLGKKMAVARNQPVVLQTEQGIEVVSAEGKHLRSLQPVPGRYLNVALSPDRTQIVFEKVGGEIYVCALDGSNLVNLGQGERPVWCAASRWIVFMVTRDDGHRLLGSDIYVIRADGTGRTNLTQTPALLEMNPVCAPDGSAIAYDEETTGGVYVAKIVW